MMIGIILVNWNGYTDTLSCLNSILACHRTVENIHICIVDNSSEDGSFDKLLAYLNCNGWASAANREDKQLSTIDVRISRSADFHMKRSARTGYVMVSVILNDDNHGFAAANNIGYKYLFNTSNHAILYYWLLNNDTELDKFCLYNLVKKMESDPTIGMCGNTLIYHGSDNIVQAYGGVNYSFATGRGFQIGCGEVFRSRKLDDSEIAKQITYISGASMFVRAEFFETVGLMSEEYFLYFEELDWVTRAKGLYRLDVVTDAIVYHKEGASIGTGTILRRPSLLSDYLQAKNKLKFTLKFKPFYTPLVWAFMFMRGSRRLISGYRKNFIYIVLALLGINVSRETLIKENR